MPGVPSACERAADRRAGCITFLSISKLDMCMYVFAHIYPYPFPSTYITRTGVLGYPLAPRGQLSDDSMCHSF